MSHGCVQLRFMKLQAETLRETLLLVEMANWVDGLAPWDCICHLTFRWEVSLDAARRSYERFMRKQWPRVSYFYAEEQNPSRDGYHIHALWAARDIYRKEAWAGWFNRFGRARIEPVRSKEDVTCYCAKYVTKEGAWWNVNVQTWHRSWLVNDLILERSPDPLPVGAAPCAGSALDIQSCESGAWSGVACVENRALELARPGCLACAADSVPTICVKPLM